MTLLFQDGFDIGDWATKWVNSSMNLVSPSGWVQFVGGQSLKRTANASAGHADKAFTASATVVVGVRLFFTANYSGFPARIFSLYGDAGTTDHVSIQTGDTNDTLTARRGTTVLATFTALRNQWMYLECKFTISDTVGLAEVRKDGVVVSTFSGDTKNAGTLVSVDTIRLDSSTNNTGIDIYIDDLYVLNTSGSKNNDYLGDVRALTTLPSGTGASTQWTPSVGNNWDNVNDVPLDVSTYNASATAGQRDTYDMPALTIGGGMIQGGTITASSTYSTETPDKSYDLSFATGWTSNGVAVNSWLMVDFGANVAAVGYLMGSGASTGGTVARSIGSWKVQGATSAAPTTWVDLDTRTRTWVVGEVQSWMFAATATYRYFRILVVAGGPGNDGYVSTSEFHLYAPDASTAQAVKGVQVTAAVAKNDAGAASHKIALKSSSTVVYGSTRATPPAMVEYTEVWETDPATSTDWTVSGIGAMEIGIEAV
jgi:hypothetical protein